MSFILAALGLQVLEVLEKDMTYIMVDVESDGPISGDYSMICFGAVVVEPALDRTFCPHHPVDEAKGNAEALLEIKEEYGLKIVLACPGHSSLSSGGRLLTSGGREVQFKWIEEVDRNTFGRADTSGSTAGSIGNMDGCNRG